MEEISTEKRRIRRRKLCAMPLEAGNNSLRLVVERLYYHTSRIVWPPSNLEVGEAHREVCLNLMQPLCPSLYAKSEVQR